MKFSLAKALGISSLISLLPFCTPKKVYYEYSGFSSIDLFPGDKNSVSFKFALKLDRTINAPGEPVKIFLETSFNGEHQYYPKNLRFEFYRDDKRIPYSDTSDVTVTTVLDGRVSYFPMKESCNDIAALIPRVKREKAIPDSVIYFVVSGVYRNNELMSGPAPDKINIKVKIFWENGSLEKDYPFELREIEYGTPTNRPFG